ncbi:MAG: sensor histidine kinase [Candidatus Nanopelagicales bacterium]
MSSDRNVAITETSMWVLLVVLFNALALLSFIDIAVGGLSLLALAVLVVYLGVTNAALVNRFRRPQHAGQWTRTWLAAITVLWAALAVLLPSATYLVFPLYILLVWSLSNRTALVWSAGLCVISVLVLGSDRGWSTAGVVGPVVGWLVAIGGAWSYQRLYLEASARDQLYQQLQAAQQQLAEAEHDAGRMAERARIAQDLHDTTAQGLTSIQMLLRSVEVADPSHPEIAKIVLARETAAAELAETRRVINDLTPASLTGDTLPGALQRIAADASNRTGMRITAVTRLHGSCAPPPLPVQVAILRVAQGAISNVERHSNATEATIRYTVTNEDAILQITDDGQGWEVVPEFSDESERVSFGINTMRARVQNFEGELHIESAPGQGTTITATIPLAS